MKKYLVTVNVTRVATYEVEIEAENEDHAATLGGDEVFSSNCPEPVDEVTTDSSVEVAPQ